MTATLRCQWLLPVTPPPNMVLSSSLGGVSHRLNDLPVSTFHDGLPHRLYGGILLNGQTTVETGGSDGPSTAEWSIFEDP